MWLGNHTPLTRRSRTVRVARNFYANSYYVPWRCDRYSCTGDYWVPVFDTGVETYRVTPDTVLPDEPGHIGNAGVVPA